MGGLGRPRCCLPPLSPFFAPLFWGSQAWGHPGSISEAEGERCPALPWLRALPSTLPGRPAPMWHRSGPISSIFLDVEFVSLRLHPRSRTALSLLRPAPRPYFSRGYGGDKGSGWVGARGPCQLRVQRCQTRVTHQGLGAPEGGRGTRSLLNGSLVPAAPAGHVSRPVPGPRGHRCPRAPQLSRHPHPKAGMGPNLGHP